MRDMILEMILGVLGIMGAALIVSMTFISPRIAVTIGGYVLITISLTVICGYAFGLPVVYTFPGSATSMALPTAICFGITGNCILIVARKWN